MDAEVAVFPEVLPKQSVHVFVGSALPWFARVGKEHAVVKERCDLVMAGHFGALIPGQRPPQVWGQLRHHSRQR